MLILSDEIRSPSGVAFRRVSRTRLWLRPSSKTFKLSLLGQTLVESLRHDLGLDLAWKNSKSFR